MAIKSASHSATNNVIFSLIKPHLKEGVKILDFGAGNGHMSERVGSYAETIGLTPSNCIYPCEIVPEEFQYEKVSCTKIGLDSTIPFEDNFFDVVYAIEVLEHTLRPYDFFKEAARVLRPGGFIIISTPNLQHILSRFSIFFSGFGELYPPPSKQLKNAGRICGHIMPLSYPYLHYGLSIAGFENIQFHVDKRKRSCLMWSWIFRPVHLASTLLYDRKLKKYDEEVWQENRALVHQMNSIDMLTSRSCILSASKQ